MNSTNEDQETNVTRNDSPEMATSIELDIQAAEEGDFDGPPLVPENATDAFIQRYEKSIVQYSKECYALANDAELEGEALWFEFVYVFRPRLFKYLDRTQLFNWVILLQENGIHLPYSRGQRRTAVLTECFRRERYIPSQEYVQKMRAGNNSGANARQPINSTNHLVQNNALTNLNDTNSNNSGLIHHNRVNNNPPTPECTPPVQREETSDPTVPRQVSPVASQERPQLSPVAIENRDTKNLTDEVRTKRTYNSRENPEKYKRNSLGVNGLLKAYSGRQVFSGAITDDLNAVLEEYETICDLCGLSDHEKATTLPLILRGNAITFYSTQFKSSPENTRPNLKYDEVVQAFKNHYMSNEQKHRILMEWQTMRLSQLMQESPQQSEAEVFHKLSNKLTRLHRQLDVSYRSDLFLRDQIIVSVDIPSITRALREKVPETSQEAINRVATFLSNEPNSAGANYTIDQTTDDLALYSLGNTFGGEARRTIRGGTTRSNGSIRSTTNQQGYKRISSKWLAGVKGCWVCGGTHQAATKHTKDEIISAINKIRARQPSAMITVDDLAMITTELTECGEVVDSKTEDSSDNIVYSDDEQHVGMYIIDDELETHKSDEHIWQMYHYCMDEPMHLISRKNWQQ